MKKKIYLILLVLLSISISLLTSCDIEYLISGYSLHKIYYVPDSLKVAQRDWIINVVKAGSNQMSGGDYEDVDATIRQAKRTSEELFEIYEYCLIKKNRVILKKDMTKNELQIFNRIIK